MAATTEHGTTYRRRMVLAHSDQAYAASSGRSLRRLGWDVHLAGSAERARALTSELAPALVVLGTELPDESGWLTCEKLRRDRPGQEVILVSPQPTATERNFSDFVGAAALVSERAGVQALVRRICGPTARCAAG